MKKFLSVFLAAMMLASMAACSGKTNEENKAPESTNPSTENTTTPSESTSSGPQYYNTYLSADPTSMDISRVSDSYSSTVTNQIMEGLVRLEEKDGEYVIAPGDAQTWESNEDGTVWTFHLGNNKWQDGQEVSAQDYVYSLQRSADPATGCPNEYFLVPLVGYDEVRDGADVSSLGVKALDEKTLEITLAYPVPSFLEMCSGTIYYPQRQDIVEQYGDQYGSEQEYTMANGPYTLESWVHNSSIVLKKNPNYWNADNVQIETVNLTILQDGNTAYTMFEAGDLDYVGTSESEWVEKFSSRDDTTYVQFATAAVYYSFYNAQDELFSNANIRKAFTLAIDREDVNEMCFGGKNVAATGWVTPAMAVGSTNYREYAGDAIQEMYDAMNAENMTPKDYLLKGMEELNLGSDPSTLDVTFSLAGTSEWFRTYGEYLQQVYNAELGVNLKIDFNDWGIFYDNVQNGNYQIGYMAWSAYYNDPYDVLSLFMSTNDAIETGWSNAEFDKLVTEAQSTLDEAKRLELYKAAEDILLKDECVVNPMMFPTSNSFYKNYVTGYSYLAFTNTGYKGMSTGGR